MRRFIGLAASGWAFAAAPAIAGEVGYAQATGYYKKESRPTLYQPLNLLDGREATAWCTATSDPLNDSLTFGFKGPTRVDEIRIYTGNGFNDAAFTQFARARKFALKGPEGAQSFTIADQRGLQAVAVNPPIVGEHLTFEVLDQYPAEDPDQPVCITDVVFYSEGKPLNGTWLTQKLKYDKGRAPLLGTWFAGFEGAPDRFLSFYFDGTYRALYDPFDKEANKPKVLEGTYDVSGSRITFEVPGKSKVSAQANRSKGSGPRTGATLTLTGDLPAELKQSFRDSL